MRMTMTTIFGLRGLQYVTSALKGEGRVPKTAEKHKGGCVNMYVTAEGTKTLTFCGHHAWKPPLAMSFRTT